MNLSERIAYRLTRLRYRRLVVSDTPRSKPLFLLCYGTLTKLANLLRAHREYKALNSTISTYPYSIRIEPVSACNMACPLCPTGTGEIDRDKKLFPVALFQRLLDELGKYVIETHLWVWGEPLLHKHLSELIGTATSAGVGTEVSTNLGIKLSDDDIDRLILSGLSWLIVSIDGTSKETYERYRIKGDFDLVIRNLGRIAERKRALGRLLPFVEWQLVPNKYNEHEIPGLLEFARARGADGARLKPIRLDKVKGRSFAGRIASSFIETWLPTKSEWTHSLSEVTHAYHDFHCPFLWGHFTVYPQGSVAPCCETISAADDLASLAHSAALPIWRGAALQEARRAAIGRASNPNSACARCQVFAKPYPKSITSSAASPQSTNP